MEAGDLCVFSVIGVYEPIFSILAVVAVLSGPERRFEVRVARGADESASYALMVAISGRTPMMFMTRVRL